MNNYGYGRPFCRLSSFPLEMLSVSLMTSPKCMTFRRTTEDGWMTWHWLDNGNSLFFFFSLSPSLSQSLLFVLFSCSLLVRQVVSQRSSPLEISEHQLTEERGPSIQPASLQLQGKTPLQYQVSDVYTYDLSYMYTIFKLTWR